MNAFAKFPNTTRTLLDTGACHADGYVWGAEPLSDYTEAGGAKILMDGDRISLCGPDGVFELNGAEQIVILMDILAGALRSMRS